MRAILKSDFNKTSVDKDARIVYGVKLMQLGKLANFKGSDGKPKSFEVNEGLISGLIGHAGNRTIPAHLSHDWTTGQKEPLHDRVGGHKNIRKDDAGDLVSDFHAMPGTKGDEILWLAENDPEHAMLSLVFSYNEIKANGKTFAVPLDFQSGDFVSQGAVTSAMLSKTDPEYTMLSPEDKQEIADLIKTGVTAQLASFKPELPASITKEEVNATVTAALANFKPAAISDEEKKSIAILAKAELSKEIGQLGSVSNLGKKEATDFDAALTAQLAAGAPDRGTAIRRIAKDKPEIYNAAVAAGKI